MTIETIHGQQFSVTAQGFAGHDDAAEAAKDYALTALKSLRAETLASLSDEALFDIGAKATAQACRSWVRQPDDAGVDIVRL